jgi:TonB-linked SusC/RagA family outer membrane protein
MRKNYYKQRLSMFVVLGGLVLAIANLADASASEYPANKAGMNGKAIAPKLVDAKSYGARKIEIRGTVSDSTGVLPGVSIRLKGKENSGTSTDVSGKYILDVPDGNAVLIFSIVGYVTQEIPVKGREVINVVLKPSQNSLDDVVVVGFGTQKRTEVVGSITTINPGELKVPSSNLTTALAGRLAGVIAYQRSGEPGADNAEFFIRGVQSFGTGKVDPLILIDGVEMTTNDMARLQPDDIESFSVMKDATSTAVYGARGANGVILIQTKRGKEGRTIIGFRVENSISKNTKNIELADPVSFMEMYNEARLARDPFADNYYSQEKIDATAEGQDQLIYPAIDWRKQMFKEYALNQRYNLNVRGGGKSARYYVAASLANDNGILNVDKRNNFNSNINLKTYTLRSNVDIDLGKTTKLLVNLNGNFDDYTGPIEGGASLFKKVILASPVAFPAYWPVDEEHSWVKHIMFGRPADVNAGFINPYADMVKGYKDYSRSLMMAQLELKQGLSSLITQGLNFRMMINTKRIGFFDVVRKYSPFFYNLTAYDPMTKDYSITMANPTTGAEYLDYSEPNKDLSSELYMESALNYARTFGKKHDVSGLLIMTQRQALKVTSSGSTTLQLSLPSRNMGISGRATYLYDKRFAAEVNFGYNGSERFHESKRWGFFPSAGVAWTISNEPFMKPYERIFNNLKVRATYGLVGNDAIGPPTDRFFYLSEVEMNDGGRGARFGRERADYLSGISVNRFSNPDITWETSYQKNLGLEIGLFNKLNILADFYTTKRTNILMTRGDIPTTMGLSAAVRANVGEATSKGMEVGVDFSHSFSNRVWLQARGNFTLAGSKRTIFEEPVYEKEYWLSKVGYSISQPWAYIAERLFIDEQDVANNPPQNFGSKNVPGDIKYKDVNRDGQITALDQVPMGLPTTPEITYGFGFSLGVKSFDFSMFFQGTARESFWISPSNVQPFDGGRQVLQAFADSHWTVETPDLQALYPRFNTTFSNNNNQLSSWWLRNGDFLRLKNAEVGYTLPKTLAQRLKLQSVRMYVNGSNLMALSSFKLWDNEMGGNGLGYPLQRVYNIGLMVTF